MTPLSFAQQRLWLIDQIEGPSPLYNLPFAVRLRGAVEVPALRAAVADVVARHEALRTVFPVVVGSPVQRVVPGGEAEFGFEVVACDEADYPAARDSAAAVPFDLSRELPIRVTLFTLAPGEQVLLVVIHHIAADGASLGPFRRDLAAAYAARLTGGAPEWEPLPVQYADFAAWQRELLGDEADPDSLLAGQLAYWRETLAGLPDELELPTDRPRPAALVAADAHEFRFPAELHAALLELGRTHRSTLFMVLQAGMAAVLTRLGAGTDVPIGCGVVGRPDEALEDLVGFFVNTLVLRTDTSGAPSFTELLSRVRERQLDAHAHQDVPFERLVEELNPTRSLARHPLFQVLMVLQSGDRSEWQLPGLTTSPEPIAMRVAKFDLNIGLEETFGPDGAPAGIRGAVEYAADLFDRSTITSLFERLVRLLAAAAADPSVPIGRIDVLGARERVRIVEEWNDSRQPVTEGTPARLFADQVARTPDAVAVVSGRDTLSYAELDARANRLAHHLISLGVGPGTPVAMLMERSADVVVATLAIVKSGGVYVPMHASLPPERMAALMADTGAPVLLTDRDEVEFARDAAVVRITGGSAGVPQGPGEARDPAVDVHPDQLAYVMFTSGSTGVPKGVAVRHRDVVDLAADHRWRGEAHARVLLHSPHAFDAATYELWAPLLSGGTVVVAPPGGLDAAGLREVVARHGVTAMFLTKALFDLVAEEDPKAFAGLRSLCTGGETASAALMRRVLDACPDLLLAHVYGPTETTTFATWHHLSADDLSGARVPIGGPLDNMRLYVLDDLLAPVPAGVPGELYVTGAGVARGYWRRPGLTAERFVAAPFEPGARMYRTGDLVRRRADGAVEFLGRVDAQVKVRGFRIELGEIEAVLAGHPRVRQVIVVAREDRAGDKRLIAYCAAEQGTAELAAELRRFATDRLPGYMVPSAVVVLDALPLNANGKVDQKALPAPDFAAGSAGRPPRDPREEILCGLFREVLGVAAVTIDDDFFELGGHSLLATRLVSKARSALDAELSIADLFQSPTVAGLSEHIGGARTRPALRPAVRPAVIPLSFAQRRLWFSGQVEGPSATYNVTLALRLTGALDTDALEAALGDVVPRHEALRTVFRVTGGVPHQHILSGPDAPLLTVTDRDPAELAGHTFDLTTDLPIHAFLRPEGPGSHVLVLVMHHIASDGWSLRPLFRDLVTAYGARHGGEEARWDALPVQYADYTLWQRDLLGSEDDPDSLLSRQLDFWKQTLAGLPEEIALPADRPRPPVAGHRGDTVPVEFDTELHSRLSRLAAANGVTVFMALQAALAALLHRFGAGEDIPVGSPVAGRTDEALDDLVGFFANTLVLRTDLSGRPSFEQLLARVRAANLAAYAHQDVPFERLVEELNPVRTLARHPLFQVMLALDNTDEASLEFEGVTARDEPLGSGTATFDLTLTLSEGRTAQGAPAGLGGAFEYNIDLFDRETAQRLAAGFVQLLTRAIADPGLPIDTLEILSERDSAALAEWNDTALPGEPVLLPAVFEAQAVRTPDAIALVHGETVWTYAELNASANRLAHALTEAGAGPDRLVALALPRSAESVLSILAILKSGAAVIPLDADHPVERIAGTIADADPALVITDDRWPTPQALGGAPRIHPDEDTRAGRPDADPEPRARAGHAAYVIHTSGSTGKPKGVVISHGNIAGLLSAHRAGIIGQTEQAHGGRQLAIALTASLSFDASWESLLWMIAGHRLHLIGDDLRRDAAALVRYVTAARIDMLDVTPTYAEQLVEEGLFDTRPPAVLLLGGEAVGPALWARTRDTPGTEAYNLYGPTETTVDALVHHITDGDRPLIGHPLRNVRVYVLDDRLRPVPPGVPGELYITGAGLARGYLNRPALTAERFTACPFEPGARMYRTGDLARRTHHGHLEYLGRTDQQIKIRGFRIEPGEIEAALTTHPHITQATVTAHHTTPGGPRLVAYVVADRPFDTTELRAHAQASLPSYMVPSAIVALDALPLTTSGKVDHKALPAPDYSALALGREARTPQEQILCGLFAEALGLDSVGIDDDFFALGGHSLLAMKLLSRVRAVMGAELGIREVFEAPTVAELVARLDGGSTARLALGVRERPDAVPLSFAQRRLWLIDRMEGPSALYNMPAALRVHGALDAAVLTAALADVMARHESLRTVIDEIDGEPWQRVLPMSAVAAAVETVECEAETVGASVEEFSWRPFDLAAELPLRVMVARVGPEESVLVLALHHIAGDGWSMGPLLRDLAEAYRAHAEDTIPAWQPLPVQYADYALWQRELLGDEDDPESLVAQQLAYWRDTLTGLPEELPLPTDRPRRTTGGHRGDRVAVRLDAESHRGLLALSRDHRVTLFMTLQAALATLLTRLGAGGDVPIGSVVAGRTDEALDDLVGFFVNTLVLRTDTSGDPRFSELVARVREGDLAAYAHQDIPFERVVEELNPVRTLTRHPLFQVLLVLQNNESAPFALAGMETTGEPTGMRAAKFDLAVTVEEFFDAEGAPAGLDCAIDYAVDLFDRATALSIGERYGRVLTAVTADPQARIGAIDVLGPRLRTRVLSEWNDTALPGEPVLLPAAFEAQAALTPDAIALVHGETRWTYAELNTCANQLAHALVDAGAGPERLVALALPRSGASVLAILAVLKSGAAVVPLDADHPVDRIAGTIADAGPALVITDAHWPTPQALGEARRIRIDDPAWADGPRTNPHSRTDARHPAYVIHTSGSTGKPKGVVISHGNIAALLAAHRAGFIGRAERDHGGRQLAITLTASLSFDASWDSLLWMVAGHRLHLIGDDLRRDAAALVRYVAASGIDILNVTPTYAEQLIEEGLLEACPPAILLLGGEAVGAALWARTRDAARTATYNLYGPTETTVDALTHRVESGDRSLVGRPLGNVRAYVLDDRLEPVPPGVPGELYITGAGLARGYLNRPALTAERFTACPFEPGARMYRTGDLVCLRADGAVEFLGRADAQVKIRGFRIELGEIEAVLADHDAVRQVVVMAREDRAGDRRLVAYCAVERAAGDLADLASELRRFAGQSLPSYMVPSTVVLLDTLPMTVNGKVDHKALPAPDYSALALGREARTPREQILCGLFAETLGLDSVGIDDDFFALGGHSLLAMKLLSRVRSAMGAELGIREVFEAPTVAELAVRLDVTSGGRLPLTVRDRPEVVPLSFAQQRLWLIDRMEGPSALYNVPVGLRVHGAFDSAVLTAALADVVARHESLRTVIDEIDGEPCQRVLPAAQARPAVEILGCEADKLGAVVEEFSRQPFDLGVEPPVRALVAEVGPRESMVVLVLHHIASDGWSMGPLLRDLADAYRKRAEGALPDWEPLPVQYADYALWQRELLGDEDDPESLVARQLAYWRDALAGLPEELALPADRPRRTTSSHRGERVVVQFGARLHAELVEFARAHRVTLFMVLQAGLAALLTRLGAGTDVPIGSVVAGRSDEGLDDLVGFFVNTLVLRTDTSGDPTFGELLARVREGDLAAYAHQDIPFERIVEELNPVRTLARHPLFQVMLVLENVGESAPLDLAGPTVVPEPAGAPVAKFDLNIGMGESFGPDGRPAGLECAIDYAVDLFDHPTAQSVAERLGRLLAAVVADPLTPLGSIDILGAAERDRLLGEWNDTALPGEPVLLPAAFRAQAALTPDAMALVCGETAWTYAELNTRANQLAHTLIASGAGPERLVALALPRSAESVLAILAILKSGAAVVPLDAEYPLDRIADTIADADPALVITDHRWPTPRALGAAPRIHLDDPAWTRNPTTDPTPPTDARHTAYVIHTSGSTGKPKGVAVSHRNIAGLLAAHRAGIIGQAERDHPGRQLAVALTASLSFDASWDGLLWMIAGHRLHLIGDDLRRDPELLVRHVAEAGVDVLNATPTHAEQLIEEGLLEACPPAILLLGGEAVGPALWARTRDAAHTVTHNLYGPTEATVDAVTCRIAAGDRQVIGRPVGNVRVYVLDDRLEPVPPGVPGELYIAGAGLARGYLNRPGLTAERFVACPFEPGARMYRTGDLARHHHDGDLEYLGRTDQQIKIRGFRIEPGEIEAVLTTHPHVTQASVTAHETAPGGARLVAYVVADGPVEPGGLRAFVGAVLPSYMVPSAVVTLDTLPLTVSGKVDHRALPVPDFAALSLGRAARTPQEQVIRELFAEVLGLASVGIDDNFFELGGHSLLAARLLSRVRSALGVELGMRAMFESPTVAGLAERSRAGAAEDALDVLLPLRPSGTRPPLFCVHPAAGISWSYAGLLRHLDPDRPVYGLQSRGLKGVVPASVEEVAEDCLREIRSVQPAGPYHLLGWSFGAVVAHAMAVRLQAEGERVALLALLDGAPISPQARGGGSGAEVSDTFADLLVSLGYDPADPKGLADLEAVLGEAAGSLPEVFAANRTLMDEHDAGRYRGDVVFFGATADKPADWPYEEAWRPYVSGRIEHHRIACEHGELTQPDPIAHIGAVLAEKLGES